MATTLVTKLVGPTIGLSVVATSHAAQTITPAADTNAVLFVNTSSTLIVYVTVAQNGLTAAASVIPTDGAVGATPIPPLQSLCVTTANAPISVTAIASAAGPTLLTVTPVSAI